MHTGPASPFAEVTGTHFARLIVLDHLGAQSGPEPYIKLEPQRLLFSADVDGRPSEYVEGLCKQIGETVKSVWGCCSGFPGAGDPSGFARWMLGYELDALLPFATVVGPSLPDVQGALEVRNRLSAFATRAQSLGPARLKSAWHEEFGT